MEIFNHIEHAWLSRAFTRDDITRVGFDGAVAAIDALIPPGFRRAKAHCLRECVAERITQLFVGVPVTAPAIPYRRNLRLSAHAKRRAAERINVVDDAMLLGWIDRVLLEKQVHTKLGVHEIADCGEFVASVQTGVVVTIRKPLGAIAFDSPFAPVELPVCGVRRRWEGRAFGGMPNAPKISREDAIARIAARRAGVQVPLIVPGKSWDGHNYSGRVWSEIVEVV